MKTRLTHLISENNYSLPESNDERDAKSIDFLLAISPPIIRSIDSKDIVFSGKDAQMIAQHAGFNENQRDEIEGIIYLIILEGHNKGANITKLSMNILSKSKKMSRKHSPKILENLKLNYGYVFLCYRTQCTQCNNRSCNKYDLEWQRG